MWLHYINRLLEMCQNVPNKLEVSVEKILASDVYLIDMLLPFGTAT